MWGQGICGPDPLYIRAQGPGRGDLLPRTRTESPKKDPRMWPRTISRSASHRTPKEEGRV